MVNLDRWCELVSEVRKSSFEPFCHPSFVFFFLIAIVIVGASGFWNEVINYNTNAMGSSLQSLRKAIMAFFPALSATTCLQIIWEDKLKLKPLRTFIITLFVFTLIGLFVCANENISDSTAIIFGVFSSLISMWMWWMANYDQEYLQDPLRITAPTGNDSTSEQLQGQLTSFKH